MRHRQCTLYSSDSIYNICISEMIQHQMSILHYRAAVMLDIIEFLCFIFFVFFFVFWRRVERQIRTFSNRCNFAFYPIENVLCVVAKVKSIELIADIVYDTTPIYGTPNAIFSQKIDAMSCALVLVRYLMLIETVHKNKSS